MSEIGLKPCKRWWDSPTSSEVTAKLLRKVVDE